MVHKFVNFGEILDDLAGIELANRFTFNYLQRLRPARSYKNFYNPTGAERYNQRIVNILQHPTPARLSKNFTQ